MNRNLSFSLLVFFLLSGSLGLARAGDQKIVVTGVTGNPMIIRENRQIPATTGMACQSNDILKTTSGCVLDVSMNQLAGCRVLASTECLLASANPKEMSIKVGEGNVILNLKRLPKDTTFQVETPTAVAAVRGTQFWGRVDLQKTDNPVTTFAVRQGTVEILARSANKSYKIVKGKALDIPKDASVVPALRKALPEELQAMEQASSIKIE